MCPLKSPCSRHYHRCCALSSPRRVLCVVIHVCGQTNESRLPEVFTMGQPEVCGRRKFSTSRGCCFGDSPPTDCDSLPALLTRGCTPRSQQRVDHHGRLRALLASVGDGDRTPTARGARADTLRRTSHATTQTEFLTAGGARLQQLHGDLGWPAVRSARWLRARLSLRCIACAARAEGLGVAGLDERAPPCVRRTTPITNIDARPAAPFVRRAAVHAGSKIPDQLAA